MSTVGCGAEPPVPMGGARRLLGVAAVVLCAAGCGSDREPEDDAASAPLASEARVEDTVTFTDVTAQAGIDFRHRAGDAGKDFIVEAKGGGGALFDADGDGWLDLYLVNGADLSGATAGPNALYQNRHDGTFVEVAAAAGVTDESWGMGAVAADADEDGDADLLVTNLDGAVLYRNETTAGVDVPRFAADGAALAVDGWCTGAAFADYDLDGDLDLYVARYLEFDPGAVPPRAGMWKGLMVFAGPMGLPGASDLLLRNDGEGFTDVSEPSGVRAAAASYGLGVVFADYDLDGDADVFVANDSAPNYLFRNETGNAGEPDFREVALEARAAFSAEGVAQAGMGVAYDDYDDDGDRDLFVTHFEDDYNTLYRNDGGGRFDVASFDVGLGQQGVPWLAFGTCFLDADNDGDQDLAVGNGHVYPQIRLLSSPGYAQPDQLLLNSGRSGGYRFHPVAAGDLSDPGVTRGLMKGDYDEDGDVDLVSVRLDDRPALLRNDTPSDHHWLSVQLQGTRSNRDAIGAVVRVVAGDWQRTAEVTTGGSYLSHSDTRAHFGLGERTRIDRLEVTWPGGGEQVLGPLQVDRVVTVRQR